MKFVISLSNPITVAYKLYFKCNIAIEEGIAYWIKYYSNLIAIIELYNIDFAIINLDDLRTNQYEPCCKLFEFIGINYSPNSNTVDNVFYNQIRYKSDNYNNYSKVYCTSVKTGIIDTIWNYFSAGVEYKKITKLATIEKNKDSTLNLRIYNVVNNDTKLLSEYSITVEILLKILFKENIDNIVIFKTKCTNIIKFLSDFTIKNLNQQIVYNVNTNTDFINNIEALDYSYINELTYFLDCYAIQVPCRLFKIQRNITNFYELFLIKHYSKYNGFTFEAINTGYSNPRFENTFTKEIDEFNRICITLYEHGIEIVNISKLLDTISKYVLSINDINNIKTALNRHYKLLRNTTEFKQLVDRYIILSLIYTIWGQSFRYKKYLGSGFYFSITQIMGECLTMPYLTISKNDNKAKLNALIDEASGRDIIILGQSPTLLNLEKKLIDFIRSKYVIGLNSVHYFMTPDLLISSYLSEVIRARNALPVSANILHTRNIYEKPLIENTMTVQLLNFDCTLNSEFGSTPSLKTLNNIGLMATALAYILKANNIFYVGIDLNDQGYFYDKGPDYKKLHNRSFDSYKYKSNKLLGLDHEHDNYFVAMNHNVIPDCSNLRNKHYVLNGALNSFQIYKEFLNSRGVNLFTLNKGSKLNEIGINPYENICWKSY